MQTVKLIQAEGLRRILVALFYAAAIFVLIYFAVRSQTPEERFQYLFFLLFVPVGIYYEILRYLYGKASDALNVRCDAAGCLKLAERTAKADLFQRFRVSVYYLQGFALLDLNRPDEAEERIEKLGSSLTSKRKLDFEYNYLMFQISAARGDRKRMKAHYDGMRRIFSMNRRVSTGIRSLEALADGICLYRQHSLEAAEKALRLAVPEDLKQREQAYYYWYYSAVLYAMDRKRQAEELYEKAREMAPGLPFIIETSPCGENTEAEGAKTRTRKRT